MLIIHCDTIKRKRTKTMKPTKRLPMFRVTDASCVDKTTVCN